MPHAVPGSPEPQAQRSRAAFRTGPSPRREPARERIVDISTGEESDEPELVDENAKKRGEARAKMLSAERRSEIARRAATARWNKER